MEIGAKIKELRLERGLTQEELGDRCELTKGYISQLENDLTSPSIATLKDILVSLGSSLSEFFSDEEADALRSGGAVEQVAAGGGYVLFRPAEGGE